ncbi:DUF4258 domain-containing protein [Novosphingobium sp. SCN 63-17]|uniref:DUF4258 domain-containing protein n=1 Tax=Novosphingobium sp. SCN 63-17 TaxID=1660120 RepID=UPI00345A8A32
MPIYNSVRYHHDIRSNYHGASALTASDSNWTKAKATDGIREIARSARLTISYKRHAINQMAERDLIISDVLYVLKNGFVHIEPEPSTRSGYNKYGMECTCPNSGSRAVRVIVIPDRKACFLKIITVMWVDEVATRAGNIIGESDEHPSLHRKRPSERLHRRAGLRH